MADSAGSGGDSKKLPKLNLHRPKTVEAAVVRLSSLVDSVAADGEFPSPLKYSVREVIHGTGAAAHSHYYLVDENGKQVEEDDEEPGHEHIESAEKLHEVEVEPYTEMVDLAQWLPHLAADADINEETWNEVRSISKEFVDALRSMDDSSSESEKRDAFRAKATQFRDWIAKLESGLGVDPENADSGKAK